MISFYNLVSKSQVTFKTDKEFPSEINKTITTKDNRIFIIGDENAHEFEIVANILRDKAMMK